MVRTARRPVPLCLCACVCVRVSVSTASIPCNTHQCVWPVSPIYPTWLLLTGYANCFESRRFDELPPVIVNVTATDTDTTRSASVSVSASASLYVSLSLSLSASAMSTVTDPSLPAARCLSQCFVTFQQFRFSHVSVENCFYGHTHKSRALIVTRQSAGGGDGEGVGVREGECVTGACLPAIQPPAD